jgi:hypothetical protein
LFEFPSLAEYDGGAKGMGEPPSPAITTTALVPLILILLAAEIAPANIRLARAAMNVFFMVSILLAQKSRRYRIKFSVNH